MNDIIKDVKRTLTVLVNNDLCIPKTANITARYFTLKIDLKDSNAGFVVWVVLDKLIKFYIQMILSSFLPQSFLLEIKIFLNRN